MFGMTAQHPRAQGVEGAQPQSLRGFAKNGGDALAHLPRRLVGEGDGKDLVGEGAPGQQDMGEAGGQHTRLARAGAGEDQQRAIDGLDGSALLGVQAGQVVGHGVGTTRHAVGYRAVPGRLETGGPRDGRCGRAEGLASATAFAANAQPPVARTQISGFFRSLKF